MTVFRNTILFSLLLLDNFVWGNAKHPFYRTSGPIDPKPFFQKDNQLATQVQCLKRETVVLLYPGYAVVKQNFVFQNTLDSSFAFFVGFPEKTHVSYDQFPSVIFDSDTLCEVTVNGKVLSLKHCESTEVPTGQTAAWRIWEMPFTRSGVTTLQILSVVKTGGQLMTYQWENYDNTFSQILAWSAVWKGPIEKSTVLVVLGEGLEAQDVLGVRPSGFKSDGKTQFLWQQENLEPIPDSDVLFRFRDKFDKDAIASLNENRKSLMDKVRGVTVEKVDDSGWAPVNAANFGYIERQSGSAVWGYLFFGFIGLMLLIIPIVVIKALKKASSTNSGK